MVVLNTKVVHPQLYYELADGESKNNLHVCSWKVGRLLCTCATVFLTYYDHDIFVNK